MIALRAHAPALRPLADGAVRSVALVRLRVGLGDLLCSVPALRALRRARPDLHVTMITWREMQPVVERMSSYVDELMDFPGYPGIPERPPQHYRMAGFFEDARRRRFDLAVQMYGAAPAANEVTEALGAGLSSGFFTPGEWLPDLRTHLAYPVGQREVDRHRLLFRFLGVDAADDGLEFPIYDDDRSRCDALLRAVGTQPGRYICVHPGATAASRRWPPRRFAAVADGLQRRGFDVLLTGVRGEEHIVGAVAASMCRPAVDVCGRTALATYAALLEQSALLVTNDSGPSHLAAATGTRSVTVFLAGDERRWAAPDALRHAIVAGDAPCRPCGHQRCPIDFRCAEEISPAQVLRAADAVLNAGRPSGGDETFVSVSAGTGKT